MSELKMRSFPLGWVPNMDPTNGPREGLLRADNLRIDEIGVLTVRPGSTKINGVALADLDVHSLFTIFLGGTKYRYYGANNAVYRNGVSVSAGVNGSGDIAFGSHMGQVFFARGTTKKKDDGTTVRNWGIAMTGGAPTATGTIPADGKTFATFDSGETTHFITEDNGTGIAYATSHNEIPNGAIEVIPNDVTGRGVVGRTLAAPTDFTILDALREGEDEDIISFWIFMPAPARMNRVAMEIDCNLGDFRDDVLYRWWDIVNGAVTVGAAPDTIPEKELDDPPIMI